MIEGKNKEEYKKRFSCVNKLNNYITKNGLYVDDNGEIKSKYKAISLYNKYLFGIYYMYTLTMIIYIIKQIPYHKVTIIGNSVYSSIIGSYLSKCCIDYKFYRKPNIVKYYYTNNDEEIAFEGPNDMSFNNIKFKTIPLIPSSSNNISQLELHTKLSNLDKIQDIVLSKFEKNNNINVLSIDKLIFDIPLDRFTTPILSIKHLSDGYYYIMTRNESWISNFIFTDQVDPLSDNEIISTVVANISHFTSSDISKTLINHDLNKDSIIDDKENINNNHYVEINNDILDLYFENNYIRMLKKNKYIVSQDFTIQTNIDNYDYESKLYSLETPRPFYNYFSDNKTNTIGRLVKEILSNKCHQIQSLNSLPKEFPSNNINRFGVYVLHPFMFPSSWDPALTLMIITQALLQ